LDAPSADELAPVLEKENRKESDPIQEWCSQITETHLRQNESRSEAKAKRQADNLLGESSVNHPLPTSNISTIENALREFVPIQPLPVDCRLVFHPEADCCEFEGISSSINIVSHQFRCMLVTT
jgi:hypothetical protein